MVTVKSVSEVYEVESQYSDTITEMVTVVLEGQGGTSASGARNNAALLGEVTGVANLGLGGTRMVSVAIRAEQSDNFPVGKVINGLFINREWTDENPYPKAVDSKGKPLAKPMLISHPEFGEIEVFSRTFLAKEQAPDTWNLLGEYGEEQTLLNAPPLEEVEHPAGKGRRVVRGRK